MAGGRRGKVREGPPSARSYHRSPAPPARVHSQGRGQLANAHSQDGDDLHEVQGYLLALGNEHGGHTLEERGPIHVDSGADGQDEAADVLGDAILLLHALHHQR